MVEREKGILWRENNAPKEHKWAMRVNAEGILGTEAGVEQPQESTAS